MRAARSVSAASTDPRASTTTARAAASTPCTATRSGEARERHGEPGRHGQCRGAGEAQHGGARPLAGHGRGSRRRRPRGAARRSPSGPARTRTQFRRRWVRRPGRVPRPRRRAGPGRPRGRARRRGRGGSGACPTASGTTPAGPRRAARLTVASASRSSRRRVESSSEGRRVGLGDDRAAAHRPARGAAGVREPGAAEERSMLTTSRCSRGWWCARRSARRRRAGRRRAGRAVRRRARMPWRPSWGRRSRRCRAPRARP